MKTLGGAGKLTQKPRNVPGARLLLWLFSVTSLLWCAHAWPTPPGALWLGLALVGLVVFATLGVLWPQFGMFGDAIAQGTPGNRQVALTFDDGPHPVTTRAVLAILREHDVRATFFLLGHKVEAYPDVVREIHAAGHGIGIHGYTHNRLFSLRSAGYTQRQIRRTREAIERACGVRSALFRPPIGFASALTFLGSEREGTSIVAWSVRSLDGIRAAVPTKVAERVIAHLSDGAIVLLHDSAEHDDFTPAAISALPRIITAIRERQLSAVRVDELMR